MRPTLPFSEAIGLLALQGEAATNINNYALRRDASLAPVTKGLHAEEIQRRFDE